MNMPVITIITSIILFALGGYGYFAGESKSATALIPAFLGLPLLICGILGMKEKFLKHAMHAAAMLGVLGFLAPTGRLGMLLGKGTFEFQLGTCMLLSMAIVCAIFVGLCVKSFIDVRRARQQS